MLVVGAWTPVLLGAALAVSCHRQSAAGGPALYGPELGVGF